MALAAHVALRSYLAVSGSVFVAKAAEAKAFFLDFFCACVRCQACVGWAFRRWVGPLAKVAGWSFCWVGAAIFCDICIYGCDSGRCGWFAHVGQYLDTSFDSCDEVGERVFVLSVIGADALFFEEGFSHIIDSVLEEAHRPVSFS